jgi:hypothetical protein
MYLYINSRTSICKYCRTNIATQISIRDLPMAVVVTDTARPRVADAALKGKDMEGRERDPLQSNSPMFVGEADGGTLNTEAWK